MKYILFLASKVGFEAIRVMTELSCDIIQVFIESEHDHEKEKYCQSIVDHCEKSDVSYILDASQIEIAKRIEEQIGNGYSVDYIISFGYRKMISDNVLAKARLAALGTHFAPLPQYRGFAPLNWLLINGEHATAVNLFYLNDEVDSGDIVERESVEISYTDDINSLMEKCIFAFKAMMQRAIPKLEKGNYELVKQDNVKATYTCSRCPDDGLINWELPSRNIYNKVRALTFPYPGAFTYVNNTKLYLWSCEEYSIPEYVGKISGKVIKIVKDKGVVVLCGENAVLLKVVQLEDGEMQTADKVIKSVRLNLGRSD